jgi:hyperosmotically inducible protein
MSGRHIFIGHCDNKEVQMPNFIVGGLLAALLLAGGAGVAPQSGIAETDDSITARVQASLAGDSQLALRKFEISTQNGIVHLAGTVPDTEAAKRAIHLVEATEGVRGVWVNFEAEN